MRAQIERPDTATEDRFHLCFALGKALEDREEFDESFRFYEQGNELRKAGLRYDPERLPKAMQRQIEVCNEQFFREIEGSKSDVNDPIFVVGLPRSGSTLLEQILASHSANRRHDGAAEHHRNGASIERSTTRNGRSAVPESHDENDVGALQKTRRQIHR